MKDVELDKCHGCFSFFADSKNYTDFGTNKLETIRKNPNMSGEQFENFRQLCFSDYDEPGAFVIVPEHLTSSMKFLILKKRQKQTKIFVILN